MDKKSLNLSLRSNILHFSLLFEDYLNKILLSYLNIASKETKAISNKSGNLSVKNKIDILFDLTILTKDEYLIFLLLTEFRNQFLHNIECNSFIEAISFLGKDKEKNLLKYEADKNGTDLENRLFNAYKNLFIKIVEILIEKIDKRKSKLEEEKHFIENQIINTRLFTSDFFAFSSYLDNLFAITESDSQDIVEFKSNSILKVKNNLDKIVYSEHLKNLWNPNEIEVFLKSILSINK